MTVEALFLILVLSVLALAIAHKVYLSIRQSSLGIPGTLIWMDKGANTKPFFNRAYEVLGKPDLLYRTPSGILAVEYKSRKGPVFASDIAQVKCAALAARGEGYDVRKAIVKTESVSVEVELPLKDSDLFVEIRPYVLITRLAKRGKPQHATPSPTKCLHCAFRTRCEMSAIG